MSGLPVLSGREVVRVFVRLGWEVARQRSSHVILVKEGQVATLSVPDHPEVARGTLRAPVRRAGLTPEDFLGACSARPGTGWAVAHLNSRTDRADDGSGLLLGCWGRW